MRNILSFLLLLSISSCTLTEGDPISASVMVNGTTNKCEYTNNTKNNFYAPCGLYKPGEFVHFANKKDSVIVIHDTIYIDPMLNHSQIK